MSQAGLGVFSLGLGVGCERGGNGKWEEEKVVEMGEEGDADVGGKGEGKSRIFAPEGGLRQWLGGWDSFDGKWASIDHFCLHLRLYSRSVIFAQMVALRQAEGLGARLSADVAADAVGRHVSFSSDLYHFFFGCVGMCSSRGVGASGSRSGEVDGRGLRWECVLAGWLFGVHRSWWK